MHVAINNHEPVSTQQLSPKTSYIQLQATPPRSESFGLRGRQDNANDVLIIRFMEGIPNHH